METQMTPVWQKASLSVQTRPIGKPELKLMEVGQVHHWPFRVVGMAPVPTEPVFVNGWWLVPVTQDECHIPARALGRVRAIYEAGIRPKAFVIAHEAPKLLNAPVGAPEVSRFEFYAGQLAQHSAAAARVAGKVLITLVPIVMAGVGLTVMMAVGLAGAVLTDPCLLAVTEDDVWVQIDYWVS